MFVLHDKKDYNQFQYTKLPSSEDSTVWHGNLVATKEF